MTTAILVDWGLYQTSPHIQRFLHARDGQAQFVLLVDDPKTDDYDHTSTVPEPLSNICVEFDTVIRNTGGLSSVKFKKRAFEVLRELSNLKIVIALDPSDSLSEWYREQGVLVTGFDL